MTLRNRRERLLRTLAFQAIGIGLALPVYHVVSGADLRTSALMPGALGGAVLLWSALHRFAFDWLEHRLTGRLARDRRAGWRRVQAVSQGGGALAVTLPVLLVAGGHSLATALTMNIALTLFYTAYTYAFHLIYDRLRRVRRLMFVSVRTEFRTCGQPRRTYGQGIQFSPGISSPGFQTKISGGSMYLRDWRERALQTCAFEVCALAVSVPVYLLWTGSEVRYGIGVMLVIAITEALIVPLHATLFDRIEYRLCRRSASLRPRLWRLVHAVSLEAAGTLAVVPLLMTLGGMGLMEAIALDLVLSGVFVTYTYLFHVTYDRLRPLPERLPVLILR